MRNKIKSLFVISTVLCGVYFLGFFARLRSLSFGGWEEGNLPSIIDIFGLSGVYTWQKQGEFSLGYSVFSIVITLILTLLVLIRERTSQNLRIAILITLFVWIFYSLLAIVYKNNYLLWKSLPYFSIYFFLVIVLKDKFPNRILSNYLISIQIIFALVFFHFWNHNSTKIEIFTINQENSKIVARYVDNYALDFREQKYINTWALMGDMEWGISGRQIANQITEETKREKLYIIPKSICERTEQEEQIVHMFADVCIVKLSDNSSNRMSKE